MAVCVAAPCGYHQRSSRVLPQGFPYHQEWRSHQTVPGAHKERGRVQYVCVFAYVGVVGMGCALFCMLTLCCMSSSLDTWKRPYQHLFPYHFYLRCQLPLCPHVSNCCMIIMRLGWSYIIICTSACMHY